MIKKALAAIALAGALTVLAPQAGFASETPVKRPVPGAVTTTTDRDAAAKQAFSDIQQRLSEDPVLARQVQRAASKGDSVVASDLLSSGGTDVVAVGSTGTQQLDSVRIRITITVCVRVWGTTYCGSVIITVEA